MAGSIRKSGDGFVADITIAGKRRTKRGRTKKELQAWLLERQACSTRPAGPFSLAQARELSLRERWTDHDLRKPKAYHRTAAIYCQAACDHFGPACLVSEITAPKVAAWRAELLRAGNRPATVNRKVSALSAMLADAYTHGHLAVMPRLPKQLPCNNSRDRVITSDEREALVEALVALGEPAAADMLEFLLETAARFGEASRLKGKDVDLGLRQVTFWQTKTGKPRTIPLTARAVEVVAPHVPAVPSHTCWPYSYDRFNHLFGVAKRECGLGDDPGLTIHTTRHTAATKLAAGGVPLHQLMAFGGWRSTATVQRYLHLQTAALSGCVAALEG
jgi:integrase